MTEDVKKIFQNLQIDKKNYKSHIDQLSKIRPDQNVMNIENPLLKQNDLHIHNSSVRRGKTQNYQNPSMMEDSINPKVNLELKGSTNLERKERKYRPTHHTVIQRNSQSNSPDRIIHPSIHQQSPQEQDDKQVIVDTEQYQTDHSNPYSNANSKPNFVYTYNQLKTEDTVKNQMFEERIMEKKDQKKMVDMQISNVEAMKSSNGNFSNNSVNKTSFSAGDIHKEQGDVKNKQHLTKDNLYTVGSGNEKSEQSRLNSGFSNKDYNVNMNNSKIFKNDTQATHETNQKSQTENRENYASNHNLANNAKTFNFNFNRDNSPSKILRKSQYKDDIRKKINQDIGESKNMPTRSGDQREWLYTNPIKVEKFDNNKQGTLTDFQKKRDQDNTFRATKYLSEQYSDVNQTKNNFASQTKEIKMSLQNNQDPEEKLNNLRDPITKELKPEADLKNVSSRFRVFSAITGNNWQKSRAKANKQGQFSEKFKSVDQICRTIN